MAWLREMFSLIRQYWRADRDYRWTMRELRREVKRRGEEIARG